MSVKGDLLLWPTFLTTGKVCYIVISAQAGPLLENTLPSDAELIPTAEHHDGIEHDTKGARHDRVERHKSSHDLATSGRRRDVTAALARGELRECACGTVRAVQTMRPSTVTGLYRSTVPQDLQGR